jgi:predicted enzyme related to lactoylglutathione lyase
MHASIPTTATPNHALLRTRRERRGCNRCVPCAGSLRLGRSAARGRIMRVAYINVFVSELGHAIEFYNAILGLELQYSSPEHGYAALAVGSARLGITVPGADQRELIGRHTGIGFAVSDLEAGHFRLSGLGVRFAMPPTKQPWGGYMALVSDPTANVFHLDQIAAAHS